MGDDLLCCPEVDVNKAVMYRNGKSVSRCDGIWCEWIGKSIRIADCQECYMYKEGCFS